MRDKRQPKRIEEPAAPYPKQRETLRAAVKGHKVAPWWAWLMVAIPGSSLILTQEREVILTDRNIYVRGERGVLIEKHSVGSIKVHFDGNALFVGNTKISVAFGSQKDAAALAAAASS